MLKSNQQFHDRDFITTDTYSKDSAKNSFKENSHHISNLIKQYSKSLYNAINTETTSNLQ